MDSSTPVETSKRKRTIDTIQRVVKRTRDAIPTSRSSIPHPSSPLPNVLPTSSTLSGSVTTPHPEPNTSSDTSVFPGINNSPDASARSFVEIPAEVSATNGFRVASGVAWNGFKTVLQVLKNSSDAFAPLKSVVGGILACVDVVETAKWNREEYEELTGELQTMAATLKLVSELELDDRDWSIACILQSIEAEVAHIGQQQAHGRRRRIIESLQDKDDVLKRFRRIESLSRRLQCNINLQTKETARKHYERTLLQGMFSVAEARYNSSESTTVNRRACTVETREKVQQDVDEWSMDPNGAKVYWMNGMAGTGKTTILYSLCKWWEKNRRLGGNFFCSRILASCGNANNILPTLAYQLARYSSAFRKGLCEVLDEDPDAGKRDINYQFEKLILEPIQRLKGSLSEGVVIAIDAMDECDNSSVLRLLLRIILKHAKNLPVKFIITSRPEPAIRMEMEAGFNPSVLYLHDIEESIVEADIKKYLAEELRAMKPPPSSYQLEQLAKRSGKLFIYAATAVRYIHPDGIRVDSGCRLKTVLEAISTPKSSKQHEDLDKLYTNILSAAFDEKLEGHETSNIRLVLHTAICAKEPLSVQTLALLLGLEEDVVRISLEPLESVLHLQEQSGLVSALHASFPDYMFDSSRSSETFHCDRTQHSQVLANSCFDVMKSQLRFNICNLESSFIFDKDIADLDKQIKACISQGLSYACRYWGEHLRDGNFTDGVHRELVNFVTSRLLFWMEVLNLEGRMAIGIEILRQARSCLKSSPSDTQKQISDAEAFVTRFTASPCTQSTPHIYISALPFCPKSSSVYTNYWKHGQELVYVNGYAIEQQSTMEMAVWTTDSSILSTAFSPNGSQIVSGSWDKTIRVWDAHTGNAIAGPFEGHTSWVNSVAFSPDGSQIVSGSSDKTIRVWDAQTGNPVTGPFKGHTYSVNSVAFSPDGTQIVSGSLDKTIRVWDAHTGNAIAGPFKGHTYSVNSVAFSPDGTQVVSGSNDNTIRVWDAQTGNMVAGPFKGHTQCVMSVAFSPDGTQIVSGSNDQTIRVWDAQTGNMVAGPFKGHTQSVVSVAFSPDGTQIVSGSLDKTIRVWDAQTGNAIAGPFEGHTSWVNSVTFSPDGSQIVSGSSDKTIRVWDAQTGNPVTGPFKGHTYSVKSVAFSPDGSQIVSGSLDKTIQVWDAQTGNPIAGPFEGHTYSVESVAFSPDGTQIASGSHDKTIRVWDAQTGDPVAGPFEGHTNLVNSVGFSIDGTRIVSGSSDKTLRVWDAETGDAVAGPFEEHTSWVISVGFSIDGTRIVSSSSDKTIRVWDAQTGNMVAGPFKGHTQSVVSVAFSPDGTQIVSGSRDETIRVWDAPTDKIDLSFTDMSLEAPESTSYIHNISSSFGHSTFDRNGWLTAFGVPLLWVPAHFRQELPDPCNTLVIGPRGFTSIKYHTPHIGNAWSKCFQ